MTWTASKLIKQYMFLRHEPHGNKYAFGNVNAVIVQLASVITSYYKSLYSCFLLCILRLGTILQTISQLQLLHIVTIVTHCYTLLHIVDLIDFSDMHFMIFKCCVF